jgi:hypothetical protein
MPFQKAIPEASRVCLLTSMLDNNRLSNSLCSAIENVSTYNRPTTDMSWQTLNKFVF